MKDVLYILLLLGIAFFIAAWQGAELEASNPNGIWLYTPPADGSGYPSEPYPVSFNLGAGFVAFFYVILALVLAVLTKLGYKKRYRSSLVLLLSSGFILGLLAIGNALL